MRLGRARGMGALIFGTLVLGCSGGPLAPARHAWEEPMPPPRDARVVDPERLHRVELAGGARVLVLEDPRLPAFELGVMVPRGAAAEPLDEAGLAALTAELMQRGAGDRDALALAEAVESLGASLSVGASWDAMDASVGGLSRDFDALAAILADVVRRPRFEDDEFARARAEQLASLQQAADDPRTLAAWQFFDTLYPGHRYGLPSAGTVESVAGVTAEQVAAFHGRVFTPRGATFYAVGDVAFEQVRAALEAGFGDWQGPEPVAPVAPPPAPPGPQIVVVDRPDLGQAQVAVGHAGIARAADDRLAVQLMNTVLGGSGFSSRLMKELRAEQGLTYSVGSQFAQRRSGGAFVALSFTEAARLGEFLDGLFVELERIRSEPPGEEELGKARTLRAGGFALTLETSSAVMSALVDLEVYDLPRDTLETYRSRVRSLPGEEVAVAARTRVRPEEAAIVVVGPAEVVVPQLEARGPVRVITR